VQHPTYKALCELGKVLKTLFLCNLSAAGIAAARFHEGLQVIDTWNSANALFLYGKGGELASYKEEQQEILMLPVHLPRGLLRVEVKDWISFAYQSTAASLAGAIRRS
jgi:TnpA family transposase